MLRNDTKEASSFTVDLGTFTCWRSDNGNWQADWQYVYGYGLRGNQGELWHDRGEMWPFNVDSALGRMILTDSPKG